MKTSLHFHRAIFVCVGAVLLVYGSSHAQTAPAKSFGKPDVQRRGDSGSFEKYIRATDRIYVYDSSQFVGYDGPVLSPWNPDPKDGVIERKGLGTILVSPSVKLNIELVTHPMGENYDLIEAKTGKLFHRFSYFSSGAASLLFTGQGEVYEYARVDSLCWGAATRKYEILEGRLIETVQPMLLIGAETEILRDVKLLLFKGKTSAPVASLAKGSKATVLTFESPDRFLLKNTLGHIGWMVNDRFDSSVSITQCS